MCFEVDKMSTVVSISSSQVLEWGPGLSRRRGHPKIADKADHTERSRHVRDASELRIRTQFGTQERDRDVHGEQPMTECDGRDRTNGMKS